MTDSLATTNVELMCIIIMYPAFAYLFFSLTGQPGLHSNATLTGSGSLFLLSAVHSIGSGDTTS